MDSEDNSLAEQQPIVHLLVEEVPNSQISQDKELEYNPFVSQDLSQAGPSNCLTQSTAESVSVKRRRGRPPKHTTLHLKPTRESQRQRKCTTVLNYESFKDLSWQWSEKDKKLFLAGCLKVGIQDIEGLKQFLPHKTEQDIRSQIGMWKDHGSKNVEHQLLTHKKTKLQCMRAESFKNLDEWINYFKEKAKTSYASTFVISNIFSFIAEFGTHPSPKECGGIDVRAMYRYIHSMMNGLPPYGLNTVTSTMLLSSVDQVMGKLNDPNFIESMGEHFFNVEGWQEFNEKYGRTYSRERMNPSKGIDEILKNPILNPLNQQKSALLSEIFQDGDSDNDGSDDDDEEDSDEEDDGDDDYEGD